MDAPRSRRLPALLALTAALLSACGTGPPDHVRIAVIAPLTGDRAYLGQEVVQGARLAIEDLNRRGGLLGADVELVEVDDADLSRLPAQLASLAERSRVSGVIGPEVPGILLGPRSPLTRRSVPALLPTAFSGELDEASTTVVRTVPSARDQAEALARWLTDVRGIRSAAVLLADPIEGERLRPAIVDGFTAGGLDRVEVVSADANASQLAPAVQSLREAAPDAGAVLLWGPPPVAARATLAVRDLGWDVQVAVPASAFVAEYRTLAGAASEGVVLPFPFREEWLGPELTSWMLRYHRVHGLGSLPQLETLVLDVPVVAVAAYDAVGLLAAAVADAGSRVPEDVADALDGATYDGVLREYRLDGTEAWTPEDLHIARFHHLATTYDVDPRLDTERQVRLWRAQVSGDYVPQSLLDSPAGDLIRRLIESARGDVPDYAPPAPAPEPVARPEDA